MVGFGWRGCAKKGLSVDDEKQQKARRLLEKGSDKVAYDIQRDKQAHSKRKPRRAGHDHGVGWLVRHL